VHSLDVKTSGTGNFLFALGALIQYIVSSKNFRVWSNDLDEWVMCVYGRIRYVNPPVHHTNTPSFTYI